MEELLNRIANLVPSLQGWCTIEKAQWLAQWIVDHRCQDVVEIGVFGGRSLVPMAMAMEFLYRSANVKCGIVDGVDPYKNEVAEAGEPESEHKAWWKSVDLAAIHKSAQEAVISNRVGAFVNFHLCTSEQAVVKFGDGLLDMVHVDGSHNEVSSTRDVELWWPKLKIGGVMVMDDTDWAQVQAARKIAASRGTLVHHGQSWEAFRKNSRSISEVGFFPAS